MTEGIDMALTAIEPGSRANLTLQIREGLPTIHPESSHPLQSAAQAIIARTDGAHSWHNPRAV